MNRASRILAVALVAAALLVSSWSHAAGGASLFDSSAFSGAGPWMVTAWPVPEADWQEVGERFGHFGVDRKSGALRLFAGDASDLDWLRARGYLVELEAGTTEQMRAAERLAASGEQPAGIPGYPCYRTVEESYAAAQAIVAAHPGLATLVDIGDSWEKVAVGGSPGYDLWVLRLSSSAVAGPKPRFFLHGAIHAREYTTAELALRFAEQLVDGYGVDADATWLLDEHEIHILLQANPDGRKQAESGASWRKNTNGTYCGATSSDRGADLNRNFPFEWNCCGGSSGAPCAESFRGASAASEPEVQAIRDYIRSIFPDQRGTSPSDPAPPDATGVYLDLHSYGALVLWPWGYTASATGNGAAFATLGRKLAWFNGYHPEQSIGLYVTDGTTDDFGYGELGVASFAMELGSNFFQACADFTGSILPDNLEVLRYAAKVARTPYLTPAGPDATSPSLLPSSIAPGEPVTVLATFDDTRYSSANGTEPVQAIAAAEVTLDTPPWKAGATPIALAAVDGAFDETIELATATVSTVGLAPGQHLLYLRGRDAASHWGAVSALLLTVVDPATSPRVQGVVRDAETGAPLAAVVSVGPYATPSDAGTGAYSMPVPDGTYTLGASAPDHVAASVAGVTLAGPETRLQDFDLVPYVSALSDPVEGGNLGWTAQAPWTITSDQSHSPTHSWTDSPGGSYVNNVDTALTSAPLDLSRATGVELSFWHRYETEATYDFCHVEVSADGGATWSEIAAYDGTLSTWSQVALSVPALDGAAQARIRFRLTSDVSLTRDGWYVDDIGVRAVRLPTFFVDSFESGATTRWGATFP